MMDLRDLEHNTRDGLHIASLAGTWLAVVAGFGGMRDHGGQLSFRPQLPPGWTRLCFRLVWHGARICVDVGTGRGHLLRHPGAGGRCRDLGRRRGRPGARGRTGDPAGPPGRTGDAAAHPAGRPHPAARGGSRQLSAGRRVPAAPEALSGRGTSVGVVSATDRETGAPALTVDEQRLGRALRAVYVAFIGVRVRVRQLGVAHPADPAEPARHARPARFHPAQRRDRVDREHPAVGHDDRQVRRGAHHRADELGARRRSRGGRDRNPDRRRAGVRRARC